MPIETRFLTDHAGFRDTHDSDISVLPWPNDEDVLLRPHVEGETWIYSLERWVPDILERLTYFALQYHEMAKEAVKSWIRLANTQPENYIFVIAYLYRHAIELRLKSIIVDTVAFRQGDDRTKQRMLDGHSILGLWQRIVPEMPDEAKGDEAMMTRLLTELHELDTRSDAFRYPHRFGPDEQAHPLAQNLDEASGENLVWVLDSITNWLDSLPDAFERQCEYETRQRRDAGY